MLDEGDTAPEFELPDHRNEPVRLSAHEGERVVLYFYPRANTEGCTIEAQGFRDHHEAFTARDVAVLGVSDDPVEDLAAFADEHDLPFTLLSDEAGEVSTLYDSYGEKQLFGNTVDGVFRNTYVIGPDRTIEAVYEDVTPEDHAETILDDLDDAERSSDR